MRKFVFAIAWLAMLSTAHAQTFDPAPSYDALYTGPDGAAVEKATIKPLSDTTYEVEWKYSGQTVRKGFAVRSNDVLAISYSGSEAPGVEILRISGDSLDGVFFAPGLGTGTEKLTPTKK